MRIGFFDSGIGGLTVLAQAQRAQSRVRGADFLYFADTASVPYGNKPTEQVRQCVFKGVAFLAEQGLDALVVACNTATAVAIEALRRTYAFPIIGMEPAVKPALQMGQGRVLVLATDMTLREEKLHRLVEAIDGDGRVDYLSMQGLVTFAEAFDFSEATVQPYLTRATAHLDLSAYGAVVLGCTHFPYFKPHLTRWFPEGIPLVDGNLGTVNNLCARLQTSFPEMGGEETGAVSFFESGEVSSPERVERFQRYLHYVGALNQG